MVAKSRSKGRRASESSRRRKPPANLTSHRLPGEVADIGPIVEQPLPPVPEIPSDLIDEEATGKPRRVGCVIATLAVGLIVLAIMTGVISRNGFPSLLPATAPTPVATVIASQHGTILMLEHSGSLSRVIVQQPGQPNWLLVSRDDTSARGASLSQDGNWVAYVTSRDGGQVVVASVVTNTRYILTAQQIRAAADNPGTDELKVCDWSPTAWDPSSTRVGFFACSQRRSMSVVLFGDLSDPADVGLYRVASSTVELSAPRQLDWESRTTLLVAMPVTGTQNTATLRTLDVSGLAP